RGAAGCPARAHRLVERQRAARRGARRPGATHRGGAGVGLTCVVVGAGLTGLAAAWELTRAGADVVVLESERRAGGVVLTERRDGFLVEGGPDGFLAGEGRSEERRVGKEGRGRAAAPQEEKKAD